MTIEAFLCELSKTFWKYYILEPTKEHFEHIFSYFSQQLVLIGTGKHEFYTSLQQCLEMMENNQLEAELIDFNVLDEWYECRMLSKEIYLVYGGIWVRQKESGNSEILIDMDTRFSFIYRKTDSGWELLHVHHSIPYMEQQNGEPYPRTLSDKAREAMQLAKLFEKKSETDLMTELYNNETFKSYAQANMKVHGKGNMYIFDIDHFKKVNDKYGHMAGDELLKLFSKFLKHSFSDNAIIGRMGGDEFAVFEYSPVNKQLSIENVLSMQKSFESATEKILCHEISSYSIGIASMQNPLQTYNSLYANADCALYKAKQLGRQTYNWYDDPAKP